MIAAPSPAVTLADAIAAVETGLAEAKAAIGTYADDPRGYHDRHRTEMTRLSETLTKALGAKITDHFSHTRVRILGVTSTSTSGVWGALSNWLTAARARAERPS